MNANIKGNTIHVNLLKLLKSLDLNPDLAQRMKPSSLAQVRAMGERVKPLLQQADDTAALPEAKRAADLADIRMRTALKQMQLAVLFQCPKLPESLTDLIRMRMGKSRRENFNRLASILEAVRAMPGFIYPPGLTDAAAQAALTEARETFNAMGATKSSAKEAAKALRTLRPEVKDMWQKLGLSGWIISNVGEEEDRMSFGLPTKKRHKAAGEENTDVLPFSMGGNQPTREPVKDQPVTEPTRTVTPPAPVSFPNLGQPKAPALASSNGTNGHSSNGVNGHTSNGVNGHGTAVVF